MNEFPEPIKQVDRVFVRWCGRKLIYFAGCDYYRLASHPAILQAVVNGLEKFGLNVAASRATTGNHQLYEELEREAARYFGAPKAILTSNGYLSNLAAAQGLHGKIRTILLDERAHSSLQDAAQILGGPVLRFKHRDSDDVKRILRRVSSNGLVLMTDGVFAHDGAMAPLDEYRNLLGTKALLWVDDAHGAGVLGKRGRGAVEYFGLPRENLIQTVTFSKAFGAYGGAILCDPTRATAIAKMSAILTGNTPLPLPLAHAALAALKTLRHDAGLCARLKENLSLFWNLADGPKPPTVAPIIAFAPRNARRLRTRLLAKNIFPPFVKYPGGPANGYFRFALSSEHTAEQITALATVLKTEWQG